MLTYINPLTIKKMKKYLKTKLISTTTIALVLTIGLSTLITIAILTDNIY
jgi:hypothetical protein